MEKMEMNFTPKKRQKYICKNCDFVCSKHCDWLRHTSTRKHKMETMEMIFTPKNAKKRHTYECCDCSKLFKSYSGLWKHKKKCYIHQEENDVETNENLLTLNSLNSVANTNSIVNTPTSTTATTSNAIANTNMPGDVTQKLVELIMSKNHEFMTELVTNLTHSNKDVMEKMIEMMPQSNMTNSHNTITTNTTNNNQFNVQMFLNEHCKNAMNLTDFIDSLPITAETYDNTIDNGLTKTITNMITNGLSQLDVLERPIHCTDPARKTLYVKEDNVWEKDNELIQILSGIRNIASKQRTLINKWKDVNDGWEKNDNIQTRFTSLICNSMVDIENDVKETNKIIRSLSKTVYLDSDVKNQYIE